MSNIKRMLEIQAFESDLFDIAKDCREDKLTKDQVLEDFEDYLYILEHAGEVTSFVVTWQEPVVIVHLRIDGAVSISQYVFDFNSPNDAYERAMSIIQ